MVGDEESFKKITEKAGEPVEAGVYEINRARRIAEKCELDLVEINGNAVPPVCRIVDYNKFLYEKKKREKEKRNPLIFRNGNINLLPADFNQRTNDNFILSVALTAQYKEENVVLLTSDNGLRLKAQAVGVFHASLADFLESLPQRTKQSTYKKYSNSARD